MAVWMVTYDKLDPQQKGFIEDYINGRSSRNSWLVGYAGSGKSLLLVHLIKRLQKEKRNIKIGVVVFTRALGDLFKTGFEELGIEGVPIMTQFELRKSIGHYDYLFCDEIQDLSGETLSMIKSRATHVITAGDSNQSIYKEDLMTRTPTVRGDEPVHILNADKKELNIIYRLTQSIIAAVKSLMPSMSRNWTAKEDLTKVDVQVELRKSISIDTECSFVYKDAIKCVSRGERTAILFPRHESILAFINNVLHQEGKSEWQKVVGNHGKPDYNNLNSYLKRMNIPLMYIGNTYGSLLQAQQEDKIIIMTYSSSKGLDFENVYMPFVTSGLYITTDEELDRTTFMVAMTRSSHYLTITYTGEPSEYVSVFKNEGHCHFTDESIIQKRRGIDIF